MVDEYDVIVVGAGIVGLATAVQLAEAGRHVAVIAADGPGATTSARGLDAVSQLHGTVYSRMRGETAAKNAAAYRQANADGFAWIEAAAARLGVGATRTDALLVATHPGAVRRIDDEHLAATRAGLRVEKVTGGRLPFGATSGLRAPDQLVLDVGLLLERLADAALDAGATLAFGERVTDVGVAVRGSSTVVTRQRTRSASQVVLATGTPILDRGLYLFKTQAIRQVVARYAWSEGDLPILTALGARGATSVTTRNGAVTIAGESHPVGTDGPESRRAAAVRTWAAEYLGRVSAPAETWSGQDYRPFNPIAFVGRMPRGFGHVWFATGFDGWGLTHGAAAAIRISADLLGRRTPVWAVTIGRRVTRPRSVALGSATEKAAVVRHVTGLRSIAAFDRARLGEGGGLVHRGVDGTPIGTSIVGGVPRSVDARCTRLGGLVVWNDLEHSWDCPVCGSRFAVDGAVLEGGARGGLRVLDDAGRDDVSGATGEVAGTE